MELDVVIGLIAALILAAAHLLARSLRFLDRTPRSWWLSFAGGVSVAYVLVHLLPEVAEGQEVIERATASIAPGLERHAFILALAGVALFYGVEIHNRRSHGEDDPDGGSAAAFWTSMTSFAVFNAVVGHLLLDRVHEGAASVALFTAAMLVHFVVNDFGLRVHHPRRYEHLGRWLLAAAVLLGFVAAAVIDVHDAVIASTIAFLTGGVLLNVLKEELPEDRRSSFPAFLVGAVTYAVILLLAA